MNIQSHCSVYSRLLICRYLTDLVGFKCLICSKLGWTLHRFDQLGWKGRTATCGRANCQSEVVHDRRYPASQDPTNGGESSVALRWIHWYRDLHRYQINPCPNTRFMGYINQELSSGATSFGGASGAWQAALPPQRISLRDGVS